MWISDNMLTCSLWPDGEQKLQKLTPYASVEFQQILQGNGASEG